MLQRKRYGTGGIALLFVLATLALLTVISTTLVTFSSLERQLSSNYVMNTWARLGAESGMAYACARLRELPGGPMSEAVFRELGLGNDATPAFGRVVRIGADDIVLSGQLDAASALIRGYRIHVSDESARLNLNDPNPNLRAGEFAGEGRLHAILRLAAGLALADAQRGRDAADALLLHPVHGRDAQPQSRFASISAAEASLRHTGFTDTEIGMLRRLFTVHSWRDPNVIATGADVHGPDLRGASLDSLVNVTLSSNLEFQSKGLRLEGRSPVNMNTADVTLLTALLQPIQGVFLEEGPPENQSSEHYGWWSTGRGTADSTADRFGAARLTAAFSEAQAVRLARAMHDRIHGIANPDLQAHAVSVEANPFETWDEFRQLLDSELTAEAAHFIFVNETPGTHAVDGQYGLPRFPAFEDPHFGAAAPGQTTGRFATQIAPLAWRNDEALSWWDAYYAGMKKHAVIANANPNTRLNDFNPNASLYLGVDKAQLLNSTAEFCFEPTGVFGIVVEAAVWSPEGQILARHSIESVQRLFATLRQTSQAQFMGDLQGAGDLGRHVTAAGFIPERFDSLAQQVVPVLTWYYAHQVNGEHYSLQSYPEALIPGREQRLREASVDGYLMPATTQLKIPEHPTLASLGRYIFAASFEGSSNPLRPARTLGAGDVYQDSLNRVSDGALLGGDDVPGSLVPDGVYSEKGRSLAYRMNNFCDPVNNQGRTGGMYFWYKPNYHVGMASRIRKIVSGPSRRGGYAHHVMPALFYLANAGNNLEDGLGSAFQIRDIYGQTYRNQWLPTRALAFGWAWRDNPSDTDHRNFMQSQIISRAVTRDYPLAEENTVAAGAPPLDVNLLSRQWNHIVVAWDADRIVIPNGYSSIYWGQFLSVNGREIGETRHLTTSMPGPRRAAYQNYFAFAPNQAVTIRTDFSQEWLRFGEFNGAPDASPYYADGTIDELFAMDAAFMPLTNSGTETSQSNRNYYQSGRSQSVAVNAHRFPYSTINFAEPMRAGRYISWTYADAWGLPVLGEYTSPALPAHALLAVRRALTLRSVAWTLYRPRHNRSYNRPEQLGWTVTDAENDNIRGVIVNAADRRDPCAAQWASSLSDTQLGADRTQWDALSIDVRVLSRATTDPGTPWHFQDRIGGSESDGRFTYAGGSTPDADAPVLGEGSSLQYRAYFHLEDGQSLFEVPALDDVTLTFSLAQPEVLEWRPSERALSGTSLPDPLPPSGGGADGNEGGGGDAGSGDGSDGGGDTGGGTGGSGGSDAGGFGGFGDDDFGIE